VQLSAGGAVSYQWNPGATLSCTACPNPIAFPKLNTVYTVQGTDANGCRNTATTEVRVNVLQPGNFIADTAICIGESVTLFANGFNSYLWFPGTDLSCTACPNPVATPGATITYFAAVEDANGCKDTGSVTITVNPLPVPSITVGDDSICIGSQTTITATGGVQYAWLPGAGLSSTTMANPVASPQTTTTYTVSVTDGNGCKNTATQSITVLPLPTVTVSSASPFVCKYDSTQITATGGVSYQWLPAGSLTCNTCPNPQAFPLVTTQYTVQVTDQYGCINNDSIRILVNAAAGNISPDTAICINDAARLRINGGVSYNWWPATDLSCTNCPTPVATPSSTITYSVQVTDANGCRDTAGVTVTVNPLPVVSAGADATICSGDNATLNGVAPTATVFTWTPASGLSNASIATPTASPAITTTYVLAVEDANTCKNRDTVVVTVNQRPNTNAGNDVSICAGDSIQMNAGGAASYTWTPAGGLSCNNCPNPLAYPTSTTTYTVRGVAANGCTRDDQVTVTVNSLPVISITPPTTICVGDNIQLSASGAITYQWLPATGLNNPGIANPVATPAQTTTYTVTGTNAAGCVDQASVTITVASPATIIVSADTSVCPGQSVQLSASGGTTYNWTPPLDIVGPQTATPLVTPSQSRTYTVDIVDANGCDIQEDVTITLYVPADPVAGSDTTICFGEQIPLFAGNGISYVWSPATEIDDPTAATTTASPSQTTVFTVSIIDANGCPNSDQVTITVIQLPNVDAGPDISIYDGSPVVLQATGAASYVWWPSLWVSDTTSDRTFAYPEDTITYYVLGTDAFGCQQIDSVTVFVLPTPKYFVPNAFSPNGDGQNDVFTVQFPENFNLLSMKIFNRWGEMVYQTDNMGQPWTGLTADGQPAPIGTYVYWLEGADDIGNPLLRQGNLLLLR
jgi:gliding motility-associated-like protein